MRNSKINTIIILVTISVMLLISVQIYWIVNVIKIENEKFERNVQESLKTVSEKIDKTEAAKLLSNRLPNLLTNKQDFTNRISVSAGSSGNKNNVSVSDFDTLTSSVKSFSFEFEMNSDSNAANNNLLYVVNNDSTTISISNVLKKKTRMVESVVDRIFFYDKNTPVDKRISREKLDSLLSAEFNSRGLITPYIFAVQARGTDKLVLTGNDTPDKNLTGSKFRIGIYGDEIITSPDILLVAFPERNMYVISTVAGLLMLSVLLILFISVLFYITIKMLLKQKKITEIKNDLINNITHEFKTPISTIQLACEALNEPALAASSAASVKYSSIIKEENNRLKHMVEDILSTAALDKDELRLNREVININDVIKDTAGYYSGKIEDHDGTLILDLKANNPVEADPLQLGIVIGNLIDNAVKYSRNKPEVTITSENKNKGIQFCVKDKGIGIPKKYISRIFDSFYRVPTGNIHDVKGHGIGLNHVKKITELHGGTVTVESKPAQGSEFIIYLPGIDE